MTKSIYLPSREMILFIIFLVPIPAVAQRLVLTSDVPTLRPRGKDPIKDTDDTFQLDLRSQEHRYRLFPSDTIALSFPLAPEFNQTVTIQPDGFVTLAKIGDVHLGGLTTEEVAESIRSLYASLLRDSVVAVELKDFNKPYFIVAGEVNRPGKYEIRGITSTTEALAEAGGFNSAAKRTEVLLFRRAGNDWYEVKPLNLKRLFQGRDVSEDAQVRPGDMLFVPPTLTSKVRRWVPFIGARN